MPTPSISIVIPAYKGARYLPITVESILVQTFADWELVIVNDGSPDDTLKVARDLATRDARIRVLDQPNSGVGVARNNGLAATNPACEFVTLIDQDDVWLPSALEKMRAALIAHPEAPAATCYHFDIDANGDRIHDKRLIDRRGARCIAENGSVRLLGYTEPDTLESLLTWNAICTPSCVLMRRKAFEQVGGFRNEMGDCCDWALWIELARLGPLVRLPEALLGYRRHGSNVSNDVKLMKTYADAVRRSVLHSSKYSEAAKRACLTGFRTWQHDDARDKLGYVRENLAKGNVVDALRQARYMAAHAVRAVCGRP